MSRRRYYGSARSVLMIRFDPGTPDGYLAGEVRDEVKPPPVAGKKREAGAKKGARAITKTITATDASGFRALVSEARESLTPSALQAAGDLLTTVVALRPFNSVRRMNSFRKADELDLQFEWTSAPYDPRIVRAMLVLHYEGTSAVGSLREGEGFEVPLIGKNLRYVGLVDELEDGHGDGGDELQLKSRDLTSLFLDAKWPPTLEVKLEAGSTIVDAIAAVMAKNPVFALVRGPFLMTGAPPPRIDPKLYPRLSVSAHERHRAEKAGGPPCVLRFPPTGGGDSSFWDVITDLAVSHGLRPCVQKDALVLLEPRVLYSRDLPDGGILDQFGQSRFPTPYRQAIEDTEHHTRRMVYGDNLLSLRFHRKLAREKRPAVEVTSRNPDAKNPAQRLIRVRWPPSADYVDPNHPGTTFLPPSKTKPKQPRDLVAAAIRAAQTTKSAATSANSTTPGAAAAGGGAEDKVRVVQIHGVTDASHLVNVAQQIYEAIGRGELGVTLETRELASYSDNPSFDPNRDPDLLDLQAGDPIRVLVAGSMDRSRVFTLSAFQGLIDRARANAVTAGPSGQFQSAVAWLMDNGLDRRAAENFVRALTSANLPDVFHTTGMTVTFNADTGYTVSIEARDYVAARADPTLAAGPKVKAKAAASKAKAAKKVGLPVKPKPQVDLPLKSRWWRRPRA